MQEAEVWSMSQIGFVEVSRAIRVALGDRAVGRFHDEWNSFEVVETDQALLASADRISADHDLKSLDALQLAAAVTIGSEFVGFACWDRKLRQAAEREGFAVVPGSIY